MGMGFSSEWSHCNADAEYCHCAEHNRQRSGTAPVVVTIRNDEYLARPYTQSKCASEAPQRAYATDIYDVSEMD